MKRCSKAAALLLCLLLLLPQFALCANAAEDSLDYASPDNWAYYALGEDKDVDVFLICPMVDTRSETNSFDLNDKLKARFVNALDMERGIYEETGRLFSPYYRQMSMNAYTLPEAERAKAQEIAYRDISEAFRWYLEHENNGRGLILAGFSQGAQMCLELLKEYYGENAGDLRKNLIAVYAIGWSMTEEMTAAYPQIVPARGETDTGVVISFDCEDGTLSDTLVIPAGTRALSINPLNWRTDGTVADKSLNTGAVMSTGAEPIPALCGAYLGARGELVVTDVSTADYPTSISIFPDGSFHVYDYLFFFTNLKNNVAVRTAMWQNGMPFRDVKSGSVSADVIRHAYETGLVVGTGTAVFSPNAPVTMAQLVTMLWRRAGEPSVGSVASDAWYTQAAAWAAAEGLVDDFDPDAVLTGEDCAMLLWRFAKAQEMDVSVGEDTNILSYSDAFDVTEGYAPALQWAVGAGVMAGTSADTLGVRTVRTRAQACLLLRNFDAIEN